jgi:hypothetical protein
MLTCIFFIFLLDPQLVGIIAGHFYKEYLKAQKGAKYNEFVQ